MKVRIYSACFPMKYISKCLNFYYLSIECLNPTNSRHVYRATCSTFPFECAIQYLTLEHKAQFPSPKTWYLPNFGHHKKWKQDSPHCLIQTSRSHHLLLPGPPARRPTRETRFDALSGTHCQRSHAFHLHGHVALQPSSPLTGRTPKATRLDPYNLCSIR